MKTAVKKLDFAVIALAALLSLLPLAFLPRTGGAARVTVSWHGETIYTGPLSDDAVIVSPDGRNTVRVEQGRVVMAHADCDDQLCVSQGAARPGRPIVCLPNELTVTVMGGGEAELDAILS